MHHFKHKQRHLFCEAVSVEALAKKHGTPLYVYSQKSICDHYTRLHKALGDLDHSIHYAVKANSSLAILRLLANLGSSFDIVSAGELRRVTTAGGTAGACLFAGVGKTEHEIAQALHSGIYCFNVESEAELARIHQIARAAKKSAPIAIRVNPDVEAGTHAKITTGTYQNKFGVALEDVPAIYRYAAKLKYIELRGLQMHLGSQLTRVEPFTAALRKVIPLAQEFRARYDIKFFSIGGGLGIVYQPALASGNPAWWKTRPGRNLLTPEKFARALLPLLQPLQLRIVLEPGRFLVGNSGILVTRVEYVKRTGKKNFLIVDAAMNDLIRPAFYDAYHEIVPLRARTGKQSLFDVVGPVCESGDFFCKDRQLPQVTEGHYLALMSAGAYGFTMASNYNSRPLAAEVLVHGKKAQLIRQRQETTTLWKDELIPNWLKRPA